MSINVFISYDLNQPGQSYERVIKAIKETGTSVKLQYSLWYVKSDYTIKVIRDHIVKAMDKNDKLIVIEASNAINKDDDAAWKEVNKLW